MKEKKAVLLCGVLLLFLYNSTFANKDSLKIMQLLKNAESCIANGGNNCTGFITAAVTKAEAVGSPYLKAVCYTAYAGSQRRFRNKTVLEYDAKALEQARISNNDSLVLQCIFRLTHDWCTDGKNATAEKYLKEFTGHIAKMDNHFLKMKALYEWGYFLLRKLDFDGAREKYSEALNIANTLNNRHWIAVLKRSVFQVEILGYYPDKQFAYIFEAYEFLKTENNADAAQCLLVAGRAFMLMGNEEKAYTYFTNAAELFARHKYPIEEAEAYHSMTEVCLSVKKANKGFAAVNKAAYLFNKLNYTPGIIKALLLSARLYNIVGKTDKAAVLFSQADSLLKQQPDKQLLFLYMGSKIEHYRNTARLEEVKELIDSAARLQFEIVPLTVIMRFAARAKNNGLISAAEMMDIKKIGETGKADTALWNKRKDPEGFNPLTVNLPALDSANDAMQHKQLTEMEIQYKTKVTKDSLEKTMYAVKLKQLKINRQNWVIFFISGIAVLSAIFLYRINKERKKAVAAKTAIAVLKKDADHRVKNSFTRIKSIINDVNDKVSDKSGIEMLQQRIAPIDFLYQLLGTTSTGEIDLQTYFEAIAASLNQQYNSTQSVQVQVNAPYTVDGEKASRLGLIVNELVTNSFKHALKNIATGVIDIICKKEVSGKYHLTVADNGCGLPDNALPQTQSGLWDVQALAQQIEADFKAGNSNGGAQFEFWFI